MPEKKLRELVASLHDELNDASSVDDESRQMLQELTGDIDKLVARDAAAAEHRATAAEQVGAAAARFESDYPRLARVLGEIVDTLGKLGI